MQVSTKKDEEEFRATLRSIQKGALLLATARKLIDAWNTQLDHDPMDPDQEPYRKAIVDFDDAILSLSQQTSTTFAGKPECPFCIRRARSMDRIQNIMDDNAEDMRNFPWGEGVLDALNEAIAEGLREDDRWNKEKDDVQKG